MSTHVNQEPTVITGVSERGKPQEVYLSVDEQGRLYLWIHRPNVPRSGAAIRVNPVDFLQAVIGLCVRPPAQG
jgi:hypothetical protein